MKGMADLTDAHWEYVRPFVKWDEQQRQRSDRRGGRWSEARYVLNGGVLRAHQTIATLVLHEILHPFVDVISDCENGIERLMLGIGQRPIQCPQARNERTHFTAAHGD